LRSAIFVKAGEPLVIENRPTPKPGPTQVLIKVARCGVCGSDLKMTAKGSPALFQEGCTPGHEYAGEIVEIGRNVTGFAPGDRVTAIPVAGCGACPACLSGDPYGCSSCRYLMGGFAEFTVAEARYVAKLPGGLSFADGALVEPLACGAQAARLAELTRASRVLVLGAGPIGLSATYWARQAGCERIAVAALSERNRALAELMGASVFLSGPEDLAARAADALDGPPDVVFECVGAPGMIGASVDCVRPKGVIVSCGMCLHPESFVAGAAAAKQVSLKFSLAYVMSDFHRALASLEAGRLEPRAMISETIGLDALPRELEALRTDRTRCKVMVEPGR
jgi:(R,R)-butanediol dehydrogenase/meso-butanediol dehydrogenase/diacetyl reductase